MSIKNRERDVESRLVSSLKKIGLQCLKFDPTNCVGMPDRMILLPDARVIWVEVKTDSGHLEEIQKLRHQELKRLGHRVEVVWSAEDADRLIEEIKEAL